MSPHSRFDLAAVRTQPSGFNAVGDRHDASVTGGRRRNLDSGGACNALGARRFKADRHAVLNAAKLLRALGLRLIYRSRRLDHPDFAGLVKLGHEQLVEIALGQAASLHFVFNRKRVVGSPGLKPRRHLFSNLGRHCGEDGRRDRRRSATLLLPGRFPKPRLHVQGCGGGVRARIGSGRSEQQQDQ